MNAAPDPNRLDLWERLLVDGTANDAVLADYHRDAVALGLLERARRLFERLLKTSPGHVRLHSYHVAVCLQQGDHPAAMTSIEQLAASSAPEEGFLDAALAVRRRLGTMRITGSAAHSLSLCMIARNEGKLLGPCLHAIKPLVDEIIMIDTGSTDRSADIARLFGATVHDFKWCDDFAAARNFGISNAAGDWILVLDADETIAAPDFNSLRTLIREHADRRVAFSIETRNYCHTANTFGWRGNAGAYPSHEAALGWFPSRKVRLFRRSAEVRFHFPVHERVEPSLAAAGITVLECTVPVHHYGHLNETRNQEKARNYYQLGYAKLHKMKHDPGAVRELAVQAGQLERWPEAIGLWRRLLDLRPGYPEALINMASAHWQLGDYRESLTWTEKALARDATLKEAHFNRALSFMMLGDFQQTIAILEPLLQTHPDYMAAIFMLSVAYACSARKEEALTLISRLQRTAAAAAIAGALEDVSRRLQSAGHDDAILQMKAVFYEPTPADAHPNRV
ncbi:MAG: glycosyltransferase [Desulfobacteraceae bacterium]|nr:MAG: glycosyltransferase [Desulfobacteraceae bacterium]